MADPIFQGRACFKCQYSMADLIYPIPAPVSEVVGLHADIVQAAFRYLQTGRAKVFVELVEVSF